MDDIFGTDASKFVFGNGITMLTPNIGTHQNLLNNLDGYYFALCGVLFSDKFKCQIF